MKLARSQLTLPLVTLGLCAVLDGYIGLQMLWGSWRCYPLILPGFLFVDLGTSFAFPMLVAASEWPFYRAANVERGALSLAVQANAIVALITAVIVQVLRLSPGPYTYNALALVILCACYGAALPKLAYVLLRTRRQRRPGRPILLWPLLISPIACATVCLFMSWFETQDFLLPGLPQNWAIRDDTLLLCLGMIPACLLLLFFFLLPVRLREHIQKALGFEVHASDPNMCLPPANAGPLAVLPLDGVDMEKPRQDLIEKEAADSER